jgi:hypothetical protein
MFPTAARSHRFELALNITALHNSKRSKVLSEANKSTETFEFNASMELKEQNQLDARRGGPHRRDRRAFRQGLGEEGEENDDFTFKSTMIVSAVPRSIIPRSIAL